MVARNDNRFEIEKETWGWDGVKWGRERGWGWGVAARWGCVVVRLCNPLVGSSSSDWPGRAETYRNSSEEAPVSVATVECLEARYV